MPNDRPARPAEDVTIPEHGWPSTEQWGRAYQYWGQQWNRYALWLERDRQRVVEELKEAAEAIPDCAAGHMTRFRDGLRFALSKLEGK